MLCRAGFDPQNKVTNLYTGQDAAAAEAALHAAGPDVAAAGS
jgi:hypothetical protein